MGKDFLVKVLDEHERTMAFAEVALGQIRSLRQTAIPRNYEIWYIYATGYNAPLNKVINETLARNGELSEAELEQIYDTYLSQTKATDRIDKVGARVVGEISDVVGLISEALNVSRSFDTNLSGANQQLSVATSVDQIKSIVESLAEDQQGARGAASALQGRDQRIAAQS
jgi:diguanylate cyclase